MVPKNIALAGPERVALLLVPVHLVWIQDRAPDHLVLQRAAPTRPAAGGAHRAEGRTRLDGVAGGAGRDDRRVPLRRSDRRRGAPRRLTQALETAPGRTVADVLIPLPDKARCVPLCRPGRRDARFDRGGGERNGVLALPGAVAQDGSYWSATSISRMCSTRSATDSAGPETVVARLGDPPAADGARVADPAQRGAGPVTPRAPATSPASSTVART